MSEPMKLYVWCDPYPVSYGTSMVFAVASNLKEARQIAAERSTSWSHAQFQQESGPNKIRLGKPDRVVELPCAEWHEWQE